MDNISGFCTFAKLVIENEQKTFIRGEGHDADRETAERMINEGIF